LYNFDDAVDGRVGSSTYDFFNSFTVGNFLLTGKHEKKYTKKCPPSFMKFKGNVRPFELEGETRRIRSTVINWRHGKFFL
jgi:hypothetical protein